MQASEADTNHHQSRGYEEAINFRPSPNFKHMKKYLKSKFEESGYSNSSGGDQNSYSSAEEEDRSNPAPTVSNPAPTASNPAPTVSNPATTVNNPAPTVSNPAPTTGNPTPNAGYPAPTAGYPAPTAGYPAPTAGYQAPTTGYPAQTASNSSTANNPPTASNPLTVNNPPTAMVQPPLPPNPPPPDMPLQITLKTEIVDDEYQPNDENRYKPDEAPSEFGPNTSNSTEGKKIMCRQFVRGICTRGPSCIYLHELILDQLPGVYTFCKNFQNSGCTFPKCKFVHATVFEKEYFYRTGFLPPHTLSHLKANESLPPPPPPAAEASTSVEVPAAFPNPPPQIMHPSSVHGSLGALPGVPNPAQKRKWGEIFEFGASAAASGASGHDLCDPPPKKCRECDITEFRYQCNKSKVEKLLRSSQETKSKLAALTRKSTQLYSLLGTLMKASPVKTGISALIKNMNNRNDIEKGIMDKLEMYYTGNSRLPPPPPPPLPNDDKSVLSTVLVRMLLSAGGAHSVPLPLPLPPRPAPPS